MSYDKYYDFTQDIADTIKNLQGALDFDAKEYAEILSALILGRSKALHTSFEKSASIIRRSNRTMLSNFMTQQWNRCEVSLLTQNQIENDKCELDIKSKRYIESVEKNLLDIKGKNLKTKDDTSKILNLISKYEITLKKHGLTEAQHEAHSFEVIDGQRVPLYYAIEAYQKSLKARDDTYMGLQEKIRRISESIKRKYKDIEEEKMKRQELLANQEEESKQRLTMGIIDANQLAVQKESMRIEFENQIDELEELHLQQKDLEFEEMRIINQDFTRYFGNIRAETMRNKMHINTSKSQKVIRVKLVETETI